jgi:ABC-2 type transport system permease protein
MIGDIALHEWRRQRVGMLFWLLLGFGQLIIAWLFFAQLQAFADLVPQLKASGSTLGAMDLVITPTFNSLVLVLLLSAPLLAMGSLAGEARSGRIALWLAAPVSGAQIVLGKSLGLWLGILPLVVSATLTLATLGLGVALDWPRFALAFGGLLLFSLWLGCVALLISGLFDHPAAALAASYGVLLFLWLLDSFSSPDAPWYWFALLPHIKPWFQGLLRSQDIAFFLGTGLAALMATTFLIARRRGEV